MAKKSSSQRVFQLAKELGVQSKDIVSKCQAESIPGITNHMSTVSVGLAVTIREWFGNSGGGVATAVETAAPVDVEVAKARAKKKATRKKKAAAKSSEETAEEKTAPSKLTETAPIAKAKAPEPKETVPEVVAEAGPAVPEVVAQTPEEPQAAAPTESVPEAPDAPEAASDVQSDDTADSTEDDSRTKPVMNVPERPDSVKPAGPKLGQPVKSKLSGPKVIRVESPEPVSQPRARSGPRRGPGGPGGGGAGGPRGGRGAGIAPADMPGMPSGPIRSTGAGGRGGASRRNKRRSASARDDHGRSGLAGRENESQTNWREQDLLEREHRLSRAGGFFKAHRRDNLKRTTGGQKSLAGAGDGGPVKVSTPISIKDLSAATGVKQNDILKKLVLSGKLVNINSVLDGDAATEIMLEFNVELEVEQAKTAEQEIAEQFKERDVTDEQPRSPVVTILGHVDHGKTSLLDRIRNANVAEGEAGGITQATSAFRVPVKAGDGQRLVTFIDTPGHEAFTEMRSRGAKVTDVVVLVVAADDGVMPQTIESINHSKAAEVPIIVALNKIDKPEATDSNIQRILGELAEQGLNPTEWGGDTEVLRVSALKGEGIQELLDMLDYQAELLELKADFGGPAEGTVLEASMKEGRGAVASILVQEGKLKKGDIIVAGRAYGRVRDIVDDHGKRIDEAGPATPVAISGINAVPDAGDKFYIVKTLKEAEGAASERHEQQRERDLTKERVTLDNIFTKLSEAERKELPLIVKGDVQGSIETLRDTLTKISTEDITISIKHAAVGGINDSDVMLAEAAGAIIVGFNVTAVGSARKLAESKGVDVRLYDVIYDITDDVKKAAEGLLDPEHKLEVLGHAEVRQVFKISKVGWIAGCYVTDGVVERNAQIRVTRDGIVIEKDRRLEQLKRFKEDVKEVRSGQECGMKINGYDDIKEGDVLECYKTLEVRRTL